MNLFFVLLLLIVCVFIALIYPERCQRHIISSLKTLNDIKVLSIAVETYYLDTGELPKRLENLVPKYIAKLPIEIWVREYQYKKGDKGDFIIFSLGFDGVKGGSGASLDIYKETPPSEITEGILVPIFGCQI